MRSPASAWGLTPLTVACWRLRGLYLLKTLWLRVSHPPNVPLPNYPVVLLQACSMCPTGSSLDCLYAKLIDLPDNS